jgi:hypothetical protein
MRRLKTHPTSLIVSEHRFCAYLLRKFRDQSALAADRWRPDDAKSALFVLKQLGSKGRIVDHDQRLLIN